MRTQGRQPVYRPSRTFEVPLTTGIQVRRQAECQGRDKLVLIAVLALTALFAAQSLFRGHFDALPGSGAGRGKPARSTPMRDWRRGEVPYLHQTDPQWSEEP